MRKRAIVVLAAGMSRRMEGFNKLMLPWAHHTVLGQVLSVLEQLPDASITIVTGFEAERVMSAHLSPNRQFVFNPDFAEGQMTSVLAGLQAAPDAETTLLALGDLPFIDPSALTALLSAH